MKTKTEQDKSKAEQGCPDGFGRKTIIFRKDHYEKLKALAFWDRTSVKDLVDDAITEYLKDKEIKKI